ncbi:CD40 ligand [Neosynchiropus ocellatus]
MINTYQSSVAAPPLPPRIQRKQPVLIPTQLPTPGSRKPSIQFLIGVVLLHLFLSVAGFMYFFLTSRQSRQEERRSPEAMKGGPPQGDSGKASAFMAVKPSPNKTAPSALLWNIDHSKRKHVDCHEDGWLTIKQSGLYYVYSKVTFSKADPERSLSSMVKLRKDGPTEEVVMEASCSLHRPGSDHFPQTCTATQGQILNLHDGNQLSLWVENPSRVEYKKSATTFGMFKL